MLNKRQFLVRSAALLGAPWLGLQAFAQTSWPVPSITQPPVQDPLRILFIGNSYYYYNNSLHNHVNRLVAAADPASGRKLQYKSATIGGSELSHHPIEWLTEPGRIGVQEPFELVVLAGNSADALAEKSRAAFRATVQRFSDVIEARGAKPVLYMTPAYVAPHRQVHADNQRKIADMYVSVGNEVGALVMPVGLAFEEGYRRHPHLRLHDARDGSHPSLHGTYLAACVVYASLYARSSVDNPYTYFGAVDVPTATVLQQLAQDTVQKFFGR